MSASLAKAQPMRSVTLFLFCLILLYGFNKAYYDWSITALSFDNGLSHPAFIPFTHRRQVAEDCSKLLGHGGLGTRVAGEAGLGADSVEDVPVVDDVFATSRVDVGDSVRMRVMMLGFCRSREAFTKASLDPFERYQVEEQGTARSSPFRCVQGGKHEVDKADVYVPGRRWSNSQRRFKAGGFTADMGWVLMVARYALIHNKAVQFPRYWGHGCAGNASAGGWTCFFQEITPERCLPQRHMRVNLVMSDSTVRERVKLKDRYIDDLDKGADSKFLQRNEEIVRLAGEWLRADNDIQTMRQVFHWIFRLQPHTRALVKLFKQPLVKALRRPYIAMHVRWGDKVGKNNFKGEPIEGEMVPLRVYRDLVYCYYAQHGSNMIPRTLFVATDDYDAVVELKKLMGKDFHVVTTAHPHHKGFSITDYHTETEASKFDKAVSLWGDMELLAGGEVFVGNMQSNIVRIVHLMRMGKPINTTLQLSLATVGNSCCSRNTGSTFIKNCFWTCP